MSGPRLRAGAAALVLLTLALAAPGAAAPDRTKPTTPTNLRVTATTSTSVSLAWNPSSDNSGSFSYVIREVSSGQTRTIGQAAPAFTWTGLAAGTTYRFNVYAVDAAANKSANSNTVTAATPANTPPTAPGNLRATGATSTSIAIAWDASTDDTGIASYQVKRGAFTYTAPGSQTTLTVGGLLPGTAYSFQVRAVDTAGAFSAWAGPVSAGTVGDTTPPTSPTLSVAGTTVSQVTLTWTAATDDSSAVEYDVFVDGAPAPQNLVPWWFGDGRTVAVLFLAPASTHSFAVQARDSSGNVSAPSNTVVATTSASADVTPPAAPAGFGAFGPPLPASVRLDWAEPPAGQGVTAYEVFMDGERIAVVAPTGGYPDSLDTIYKVRHLQPGSTHTFTVRARDEAHNLSAPAPAVVVTTPASADTTAPSVPGNLHGTSTPCAFPMLDYTTSTDNADTASMLEYEVYEDGVLVGFGDRYGAFVEGSYGVHTYVVRAVDRAGNTSGPSNELVLVNNMSNC